MTTVTGMGVDGRMETKVNFIVTGGVIVPVICRRQRRWTLKKTPGHLVGGNGWYWSWTCVVVPETPFQTNLVEMGEGHKFVW